MNEAQPEPRGPHPGGEEAWIAALRARFVDVASRRVAPDAVEDVVQDALSVVALRLRDPQEPDTTHARPSLAWCFQTLRNVIGDHYRRTRRLAARRDDSPGALETAVGGPDPIEALAAEEIREVVHRALARLASLGGGCARYLERLGEGLRPAELAREEGLQEAVLYRRIYRCRQKLREVLETMGVDA